ncbi:MAG: glycosyltransferase family 4 protein [Bacteroidales bacterium]|nr:glycosyltransferase family 4 protein [Bacteroidales bacterium]
MKIAFCLPNTYILDGLRRIITYKANLMASHGHEVFIITTDQDGRPDAFTLHPNVKRIDLDLLYPDTLSLSLLKRYFSRRKLQKRHKRLLTRLLKSLSPDITTSTFHQELRFLPHIKDGSKKIVEHHGCHDNRILQSRPGVWKLIDRYLSFVEYRAVKGYDCLVCLTRKDKLAWKGIENIAVIPGFIKNLPDRSAPLTSKSMIAAGRFSREKGFDMMIAAWSLVAKKHPDWKLHIFGDGILKKDLQKQISDLQLADVITLHKPIEDIENEYLRHSALISSSRVEGFGLTIIEAMKCGLPPVSFDSPNGPQSIITHGHDGLLVPLNDTHALADQIIRLIEHPDLRKTLGRNAISTAANYEAEKVIPQWEQLYASILPQ